MHGRKRRGLLALAVAVFVAFALLPAGAPGQAFSRPNFVLILTDDQSPETLPHSPPVMPFLQRRVSDASDHWIRFTNAFVNTPLCCPSRASVLTGRYAHNTGVQINNQGARLDESSTLATWLHDAGYWTGFVGKYLNFYPFDRGHYVPPGWDRWFAKEAMFTDPETALHEGSSDYYYNYLLNENGIPVAYGSAGSDYSTDVFAGKALDFIDTAPPDRPFFLYLAFTAPHSPRTPAPRHVGAFSGIAPTRFPNFNEADVSDKPSWVRQLPLMGPKMRARVDKARRDQYEALLSVDEAVASVLASLESKSLLENTVVVFLSDNGWSFGEHRWNGCRCLYEECISTPLLIRYPWANSRTDTRLVSNVDLAPTLAELAGVTPSTPMDGRSLVPLLEGTAASWRTSLLLEWAGHDHKAVAPYWAVRTKKYVYAELGTGERELYDLTGSIASPDPYQLTNRAGRPAYARVQSQLAALLARLKGT